MTVLIDMLVGVTLYSIAEPSCVWFSTPINSVKVLPKAMPHVGAPGAENFSWVELVTDVGVSGQDP